MFDHELQSILDDEDWFVPKGKFQYIDASCTLDGKVVRYDRGELKKDAVADWAPYKAPPVDSKDQPLYHFKLICISPDESEENPKSKLLASKETYEAISAAWRLPSWTPRFFDQGHGNSATMPFGSLMPTKTKPKLKTFGLAIKNANSHRMILIHDPETRTTSVILCESPNCDPDAEEVLFRIEQSKEATLFPLLAPFLLVEGLENEINDIQLLHRNRIEAVERKTYFYAFDDEESDDGEEADDLVDFTREYTKIHSLSRSLQMSLDDALQGALLLREMHELWYDGLDAAAQDLVTEGWHELSERLLLTEKLLRQNSTYITHDQSGIQLSIQTIYALIGTNDSRLNYETAQSSLRIAEDSRKVAVLTRYDSTDMRVIAGTTLLFLPATFVATLFSTNFFNFKPSGDGLVSHYIWIYCVVSAVLTIAVMTTWRLLSRRREQETTDLIGPSASAEAAAKEVEREEEQKEEEAKAEGNEESSTVDAAGGSAEEVVDDKRSSRSNMSFDGIKNRLSKRKKTRTMEMEETLQENEKSRS